MISIIECVTQREKRSSQSVSYFFVCEEDTIMNCLDHGVDGDSDDDDDDDGGRR